MPSTYFVTIKSQPYEVKATSDFYFNKVTGVIAAFSTGVDVKMLNEAAEAVKTAIIPSVPARIITFNPVTESCYWNVNEDDISELLLQIYEAKLKINIDLLQEEGGTRQEIKAAQEKLTRFQDARQRDSQEAETANSRAGNTNADNGNNPPVLVSFPATDADLETSPASIQLQQESHLRGTVANDISEVTTQVIERLLDTLGMTQCRGSKFKGATPKFKLKDGTILKTYKNPVGVDHVFLADSSGKMIFGGYVGWIHSENLKVTLSEIKRTFV